MRVLTLQRSEMRVDGTLGAIRDERGKFIVSTLERPWLGNKRNVSCIPAGSYTARRYLSPKRGYDVFQLEGVPDRDNVQIHRGNFEDETEGCILVGLYHDVQDDGSPMVTASKIGFQVFMNALIGEDSFTLAVVDPQPLAA